MTKKYTVNKKSYTIKGKDYPRVTKILSVINSPGLNIWKAKVGLEESYKISEETSKFGTEVHTAIKDTILKVDHKIPKELYSKKEELLNSQKLAFKFLREYRLKPLSLKDTDKELFMVTDSDKVDFQAELLIRSDKFKYAGTLDLVAKRGKHLYIIDWKTSERIYKKHLIQLCAYKVAYEEMTGKKIYKGYIVSLGKGYKKNPLIKEVDWTYFSYFVCALKLYKGGIS